MKFYVNYTNPDTKQVVREEFPKLKKAREFYIEVVNKFDNRCNVTITDEKGKEWKHSHNYLRSIFDNKVNFKYKDKYGTPSFMTGDQKSYSKLFDEDGRANYNEEEIREFVTKNRCSPFSDIMKYYWSHLLDTSTKGFWHASSAF